MGARQMSYSKENLRKHTLTERVRLHQLISSGMKEIDAINRLFPTKDRMGRRINSNRMAKLRLWTDKGLWPVSETDLKEAKVLDSNQALTTTEARFNRLRDIIRKRNQPKSYLEQRETNPKTVHMSVRLPAHLDGQLKKLNGTRTENLIAAVTSYLAHHQKSS
jgi:hypothetical protein